MLFRLKLIILIFAIFLLAGCATGDANPTPTMITQTSSTSVVQEATPAGEQCAFNRVAYPSNSQDGNHFISGRMDLPNARQVIAEVGGEIIWVVGLGNQNGSRWLASDSSGRISEIVLEGEQTQVFAYDGTWPQAAPLAITRSENGVELVGKPLQPFSPLSHPIQVSSGLVASLATDGQLALTGNDATRQLALMGLPDARLLTNEAGEIALYTNPTNRYQHAVLGDGLEGAGLAVVDPNRGEIAWSYQAPGERVFEGLAPLWVDLNQDGQLELIATISDRESGARYSAIDAAGERVSSRPIGQGFRWRHAIAVAPVALDGSWELVGVRTPHLGGIVEYLSWQDDELVITAELPGYSSHQLGSRNLDQALVADFDGDGRHELLVPTQDYSSLAAISRIESGAVEAWRIDLPANLTTNLAVACHQGETLVLAAGFENGQVAFWLP